MKQVFNKLKIKYKMIIMYIIKNDLLYTSYDGS